MSFNLRQLWRAGLARALTPAALFELGNLATTLLILRASNLLYVNGRSLTAATTAAILLYALHNAAATVSAIFGGQLADRFSPRIVFGAGGAVYVCAYAVFAWDQHVWWMLGIAFVLSGVGIGFAETAESTTVAVVLPDHLRGNGFGVLGLVQSFGDLGASLVARRRRPVGCLLTNGGVHVRRGLDGGVRGGIGSRTRSFGRGSSLR